MPRGSIVGDILGKIGLSAEKQGASPIDTSSSGPSHEEAVDFTANLGRVLAKRKNDIKGHVFLVDLSKVRARLGDQWPQMEAKVHKITERVMADKLSADDLTIRYDENSYLLIFPMISLSEGRVRSALVNQEIVTATIGQENPEPLMDVKAVDIASDGSLSFHPLPPMGQLIQDFADRVRDWEASGQMPAGDTGITVGGIDGIKFVFAPLLAVKTRVISTYLCIPIRRGAAGNFVSGYRVLGLNRDNPLKIQALDHQTLEYAGKELGNLVAGRGRSLIALPVHFETLANHSERDRYRLRCAELFENVVHRIVFEVVGLPEGIPQPRLLELVSALKPYSRAVIARFSHGHREFPAYQTAGLHAVGMDLFEDAESEDQIMRDMNQFAKYAAKIQLRTYVLGVRSLSLFTGAMTAGFDYISGYALSSPSKAAEDIQAFQLEQIYRSLLGTR